MTINPLWIIKPDKNVKYIYTSVRFIYYKEPIFILWTYPINITPLPEGNNLPKTTIIARMTGNREP